jgi:hypothetical protein
MYCTKCGKPNSDVARFCLFCGSALPPVVQQPQAVASAIAPATKKKSNTTLTVVLVIVGVLVLSPILIAFVVGFAEGFGSSMETADQKVARLMREAAGLQPVKKPFLGEGKIDTQLRDLFRKLIQLNKSYQAEVQTLDVSQVRRLATPESFADPSSADEGLRQLHAAYDLDAQQEQRLRQLLDDFRTQLNDVPVWQRQNALDGFNRGLAQSMAPRERATSTEKAWVDAMDDVYNYAELHHVDFSLRYGQLTIADDSERQEFNAKVEALNARHKEFNQAQEEFNRFQGSALQKMGVSQQQLGAH